jgi:hypothetical protein
MDSSSSSFIPLSMHVLYSKLNFVGISLGKNSSEINVSANCRGDDYWGTPRAVLSADWRPRNLHGAKSRGPAPSKGPAAPAAGWRLHRGEPEPGEEDKIPPTAVLPKVVWPRQDR